MKTQLKLLELTLANGQTDDGWCDRFNGKINVNKVYKNVKMKTVILPFTFWGSARL